MVEVSLTVGKLDASLALLLTEDHHLIEFPTILLPKDATAGSVIKISCEANEPLESDDQQAFLRIQDQIMQTFGTAYPKSPALRVRNVTETSAVLEWDPIDTATADIISLALYKNGARFGIIPSPLKRTAIKLSGLAIDTEYTFYLVLATTGGTYKSDVLTVKTHKMTDLSGLTICLGTLVSTPEDPTLTKSDLESIIHNIGAKPLTDTVRLDTTHFVCTKGEGPQWQRALDLNIPVVRPEWVQACEAERRLVSVRAYYLNADPSLRPPVVRTARTRADTAVSEIIEDKKVASESGPVKKEVEQSELSNEKKHEDETEANGSEEKQEPKPEGEKEENVEEKADEKQDDKPDLDEEETTNADELEDVALWVETNHRDQALWDQNISVQIQVKAYRSGHNEIRNLLISCYREL